MALPTPNHTPIALGPQLLQKEGKSDIILQTKKQIQKVQLTAQCHPVSELGPKTRFPYS